MSAGDDALMPLLAAEVRSHKQLPLLLYEIGTQRTSQQLGMVSGLSLHADPSGLVHTTEQLLTIFAQIMEQAGIRPITARGPGGQSLLFASPSGTDELVVSDRGNYAALLEGAEIGPRDWTLAGEPVAELQKVHTPGIPSVEAVSHVLDVTPRQVLKTLVYQATSPIAVNYLVAVVRGDHQVDQAKLAAAATTMGVTRLELVDSPRVREKFALGFVGPDAGTKVPDAVLIVDPDAAQGGRAWVAGANETDFHVRHFNWFRECGDRLADPTRTLVADIRKVLPGDPSPVGDGGVLEVRSALELARVGRRDDGFGASFDDSSGCRRPIVAGTFTLDLFRLIRATVESHHDECGILWPPPIAPCAVVITPVQYDGAVKDAADKLYTQLLFEEVDTILDDRDARAGFKFADADLIGFPIRITVGPSQLAHGNVELKLRAGGEAQRVPINEVVSRVRAALAS